MRFVRECFGTGAHERVLQALPERHWGTFHGPVREASWEPVADVVAYMEAAHRLLAPDDDDFYLPGRAPRLVRHARRALLRVARGLGVNAAYARRSQRISSGKVGRFPYIRMPTR